MGQVNTDQELKVNKGVGEFLMIVVCQWPFRFKIVKTLSTQTEVVFCLEVEKTHRQVRTKTTQPLVLQLKSNHTQRQE